jgi:hypothetical protein
MDLMKEDLIFVITFGFYMRKQAERKTHLGTPKASYRALVCREITRGCSGSKLLKGQNTLPSQAADTLLAVERTRRC